MKRLLLLSAAFLAAPAAAQSVAITNAKLVIGDGSAPIEGGTVIVRDGRVVAAGKAVAGPAGIATVDASGRWVTPGIVAGFTRMGIVEVDGVEVDERRLRRLLRRRGRALGRRPLRAPRAPVEQRRHRLVVRDEHSCTEGPGEVRRRARDGRAIGGARAPWHATYATPSGSGYRMARSHA